MALKVFIFLWMFFSTSNEVKLGECYSQYGANKQESIDWCDMVSKHKYFPELSFQVWWTRLDYVVLGNRKLEVYQEGILEIYWKLIAEECVASCMGVL